jgi:hypothetical protein
MEYEGGSEDEGFEDEGDALGELVEQVKALSAELEKLKAERACCSFEESAEDFQSLKKMFLAALLMMVVLKIS